MRAMKGVALGVLLLAAAPLPALACPPRGTPVLRVELNDPEPRLLAPVPAAQLSAEDEEERPETPPHHGQHHLGLTLSRVDWTSEITVRVQAEGGVVCAVPAELRVIFDHVEHTIRLAAELPRGGCLAQEVLAHERRHAEVNRRTLREAVTRSRQVVRGWAASAEARAPDAEAAAAALQQSLAQALSPVLEGLRAARERGHAAIDSAEEYRRLGRVCPADQRRLRAALAAD